MNPTFIIITLTLLLGAATLFAFPKVREWQWMCNGAQNFVNAITAINITPEGRGTRIADNAFTARYLIAKAGSDAAHIDICTASDKPLGIVTDMTPSTDASTDHSYPLPINFLGLNDDTERVVASGVVAVDDMVVPDASGKVKTLPTSGGGTTYVIGKALTAAAADNDLIEIIPCFPYAVTIPA